MVKKVFVVVLLTIIFCGNVKAETYYENDNGVILSKPEYDFIVELYNKNYPSVITMDEYNLLKDNNIFGQEIKRVSTDDVITNPSIGILSGSGDYYETPYKRLEAGCACGDTCVVSATLDWKKTPSTRSYDLFGAMQIGSTAPTRVSSHKYVNGSSAGAVEYITNGTGASATHRLPNDTSLSSLSFDLSFVLAKRGNVFISYQHATKNITLVNTRKFTFNHNGYGYVYLFDQSIRPYYDDMSGLELEL